MNSTPVNGSASHPISGTIRLPAGTKPLWNAGWANVRLSPPPAPNWKPRPEAGSFSGGTTGGLSFGTVPPLGLMSAIRVKLVPQPVWNLMLLSALSARLVPPTPVANGELGGKSTLTKPTPPGKLGGKDS